MSNVVTLSHHWLKTVVTIPVEMYNTDRVRAGTSAARYFNISNQHQMRTQNRLQTMLKPASNNMKYQMTKSPKIGLIFKILNNILMKFMHQLKLFSGLRYLWWYSWDVRAEPLISKIEIERAYIDSNSKSWHRAVPGTRLNGSGKSGLGWVFGYGWWTRTGPGQDTDL